MYFVIIVKNVSVPGKEDGETNLVDLLMKVIIDFCYCLFC